MKKYILGIAAIAAAVLLQSCGNFLDEELQSEMIPKTATDFSELLIGNGYPDHYSPSYAWLSYMDDDCEGYLDYKGYDYTQPWPYPEIDNFAGQSATVTPMPYYTWQPYSQDQDGYGNEINATASSTTYGQFYSKIMGCNAVLDDIDDAYGAQNDKDRVKAEALAVRAFLYWTLVNIYGEPYNYNKDGLGVPLKTNANLSTDGIARSTVGEVYDNLIVPDLQEAAKLMDPLDILTSNYRINQPTIHILLSRVYLFMERYQDCIDEANKALKQGIRLMNLPSELGESYKASQYNPFSYSNPEVTWIFGPDPWDMGQNYWAGHATGFRAIWDQENDLRWLQYGLTLADNTDVILKDHAAGLSQNIRTAEAYLNKMEAEALLGKEADALADFNTFCATRYKNYSNKNLSGDELLKEIRLERRREFCFEGTRWFDLRRQGMPEIQHPYRAAAGGPKLMYTLKHNDPLYTIPIPRSVITKNTLIEQNASRNEGERQPVEVSE